MIILNGIDYQNKLQKYKKNIFIYTQTKQKVMSKQLIKGTDGVTNASPSLEERKLKALEKIANSLDALTIWFEEIDKDAWGPRIEHYLYEWYKNKIEPTKTDIDSKKTEK